MLFPLQIKSIRKVNSDRFDFRDTTLAGAYTARMRPFFGSTHPVTRTKCLLPFTSKVLQKAFGNLNPLHLLTRVTDMYFLTFPCTAKLTKKRTRTRTRAALPRLLSLLFLDERHSRSKGGRRHKSVRHIRYRSWSRHGGAEKN